MFGVMVGIMSSYSGRGSTRPEVKSAPESSQPLSQQGLVYFQSVYLRMYMYNLSD